MLGYTALLLLVIILIILIYFDSFLGLDSWLDKTNIVKFSDILQTKQSIKWIIQENDQQIDP